MAKDDILLPERGRVRQATKPPEFELAKGTSVPRSVDVHAKKGLSHQQLRRLAKDVSKIKEDAKAGSFFAQLREEYLRQIISMYRPLARRWLEIKENQLAGGPGRPHHPEDLWAWNEVNKNGRMKNDIYDEYLKRRSAAQRTMGLSAKRQFRRVTAPNWLEENAQK